MLPFALMVLFGTCIALIIAVVLLDIRVTRLEAKQPPPAASACTPEPRTGGPLQSRKGEAARPA